MHSVGGTTHSCTVPPATAAGFYTAMPIVAGQHLCLCLAWSVHTVGHKWPDLHLLCFTAIVQQRPESLHEGFLASIIKTTILYLVFKSFDSLWHLPSSHRGHLWILLPAVVQGFLLLPGREILPLWGNTRYVLLLSLHVSAHGGYQCC